MVSKELKAYLQGCLSDGLRAECSDSIQKIIRNTQTFVKGELYNLENIL